MASQTLHQREALAAVTRRRMRGLSSTAPTRNGASAAVPPPAAEQAGGARVSSSFTVRPPADPFDHPAVQFASLCVGWTIMGGIMWACLMWGLIG